jgi:hypothetical protein
MDENPLEIEARMRRIVDLIVKQEFPLELFEYERQLGAIITREFWLNTLLNLQELKVLWRLCKEYDPSTILVIYDDRKKSCPMIPVAVVKDNFDWFTLEDYATRQGEDVNKYQFQVKFGKNSTYRYLYIDAYIQG